VSQTERGPPDTPPYLGVWLLGQTWEQKGTLNVVLVLNLREQKGTLRILEVPLADRLSFRSYILKEIRLHDLCNILLAFPYVNLDTKLLHLLFQILRTDIDIIRHIPKDVR